MKDDGLYKTLRPCTEQMNQRRLLTERKLIFHRTIILGFANHPRLEKAAIAAIEKYGVGAGAVRPIIGNMKIHNELEAALAKFKREISGACFSIGF